MRIGLYASIVASDQGHERNVSAHVQLPVHTLRVLRDAGHEASLITNEYGPDKTMPTCMPDGAPVHLVPDGRKRPKHLRGGKGTRGVSVPRLLRQLRAIIGVARRERLEVLHAFGYLRSGCLAGMLRLLGLPCPVVFTFVGASLPPRLGAPTRFLLRRVDRLVASTEYTASVLRRHGFEATVCRHGIVRDLTAEAAEGPAPGPRKRVLFWRDPTPPNGCDTALAAFERVAPEFPELSFDFAVRPAWDEIEGLDAAAERIPNLHVHRFPYEAGITLPRLVAESLLVVMPFRDLSVDPQFAIAESLAAGCSVIASDIRSNPELVSDCGGRLVPPGDADALAVALRDLLADPDALVTRGVEAAREFAAQWNWDGYVPRLESIYAGPAGASGTTSDDRYTRSPDTEPARR